MSKLLSDKKKIPKQTPAKWNVSPISEATSPQKKIKSVTFEDVQPPTSAKRRNIREKHQNRNLVKTSHGRRTEVKRRKTRKKKEKKTVKVEVSPSRSGSGRHRRQKEQEKISRVSARQDINQRTRRPASESLKAQHAGHRRRGGNMLTMSQTRRQERKRGWDGGEREFKKGREAEGSGEGDVLTERE